MVELRYPLSALAFDYLRGVLGLGIAVLIIQTVGTDTPVFWVFVGLAVLFLIWLGNTFLRHMSRIRFDQDGLSSVPWPKKSIAWNGLKRMELRYYTTKRRRKSSARNSDSSGGDAAESGRSERGWMTLTLRSERQRIDIESTLPHFADIAARAAHAAKEAGVSLDQVTIENLSAIGVKGDA